eukprot:gene25-24_t
MKVLCPHSWGSKDDETGLREVRHFLHSLDQEELGERTGQKNESALVSFGEICHRREDIPWGPGRCNLDKLGPVTGTEQNALKFLQRERRAGVADVGGTSTLTGSIRGVNNEDRKGIAPSLSGGLGVLQEAAPPIPREPFVSEEEDYFDDIDDIDDDNDDEDDEDDDDIDLDEFDDDAEDESNFDEIDIAKTRKQKSEAESSSQSDDGGGVASRLMSEAVGTFIVFTALGMAEGLRYLSGDPIFAKKVYKHQDVDGLHHAMPKNFASKTELEKIHFMDPEDLLREEVEDLDLLPVSHRAENMRVLDELTAAGISYKYTRYSWEEKYGAFTTPEQEGDFRIFNEKMGSGQATRLAPILPPSSLKLPENDARRKVIEIVLDSVADDTEDNIERFSPAVKGGYEDAGEAATTEVVPISSAASTGTATAGRSVPKSINKQEPKSK